MKQLLQILFFLPFMANSQVLWGVHSGFIYDPEMNKITMAMDRAKEIGVKISREDFLWCNIEASPGNYSWGKNDYIVTNLRQRGITVLGIIFTSPTWANGGQTIFDIPQDEAAFQAWVSKYANFTHTLVSRYKNQVRHWEIWNEPNLPEFWRPLPDSRKYGILASALTYSIRHEDPSAFVLVGSLYPVEPVFLQGIYDNLNGIKPNGISVHPYTPGYCGNSGMERMDGIRNTMLANGDKGELWITEIGWICPTPDEQARKLAEAMALLKIRYTYVRAAMVFCLYDLPAYKFGLLDANLNIKPSGYVFKSNTV